MSANKQYELNYWLILTRGLRYGLTNSDACIGVQTVERTKIYLQIKYACNSENMTVNIPVMEMIVSAMVRCTEI